MKKNMKVNEHDIKIYCVTFYGLSNNHYCLNYFPIRKVIND